MLIDVTDVVLRSMGDGRIVGDGKIELHTTQALGWGSYIAEAS